MLLTSQPGYSYFYHWYKPRDRSEKLLPNRVLKLHIVSPLQDAFLDSRKIAGVPKIRSSPRLDEHDESVAFHMAAFL